MFEESMSMEVERCWLFAELSIETKLKVRIVISNVFYFKLFELLVKEKSERA